MAYDSFTQEAREVFLQAEFEASYLGETMMTPMHMLLAIARKKASLGSNVLKNREVSYGDVLGAVLTVVGYAGRSLTPPIKLGEMQVSPQGAEVIERARQNARCMGHDYRGVEHLVLGIADVAEAEGGNIERVFGRVGVTPSELRGDVKGLLGQRQEAVPAV